MGTSEASAPAVTRVPAAMSCYQAGAHASGAATSCSGTAAPPLVLPDNSVSCSFGLAAPGDATVFSLVDLQLKPRGGAALRTAPAAAAAAADAPGGSMLYALEWTAVEPAAPAALATATTGPLAARWSLQLASEGAAPAAAAEQRHVAAAGHGPRAVADQMRALQSALTAAAGWADAPMVRAAMSVRGLPEGTASSPAAVRLSAAPAAIALMRVAAQEAPAVAWTTCAFDGTSPREPPAPAAADSFAVACTGGAWLAPRLVAHSDAASAAAAPPQAAATLSPAEAFCGTVLVSGGLGDIGLLAAQWVAATAPAARLVLLSRSGRSSRAADLAARLHAAPGAPCVTAARCDVGSRDEVEALVACLAAAGATVSWAHMSTCLQIEVADRQLYRHTVWLYQCTVD